MSRCGLGSAATQLSSLRPSSTYTRGAASPVPCCRLRATSSSPVNTTHRPSLMLMSSPSHQRTSSSNHPPHIVTFHRRCHCHQRAWHHSLPSGSSASKTPAFFDTSRTDPRPPQRRHGYLLHVIIRAICSPSFVAITHLGSPMAQPSWTMGSTTLQLSQ